MRYLLSLLLLLSGTPVIAQVTPGTVTLALEISSSANGAVTPKATWSTTPAADSCTASGAWTGSKAAAGSETEDPVSKSAVYTLTCSWSVSQAKLTWTLPTQNTDGGSLTDLAGTRIFYSSDKATTIQSVDIPLPGTTKTITGLAAGVWSFTAKAHTSSGVESVATTPVQLTTGTATTSKSVSLAVNIPNPPTNFTVE